MIIRLIQVTVLLGLMSTTIHCSNLSNNPTPSAPESSPETPLEEPGWPVDASKYKVEVSDDKMTYYALPIGPVKGIILCFHGTGGEGRNWFGRFLPEEVENSSEDMGRLEGSLWVYKALEAGLVVIAPTSRDRQNKQWRVDNSQTTPSVDATNVLDLVDSIKAKNGIMSDRPHFSMGMSNGGGFAPYFAYWANFDKVVIHSAPAGVTAFNAYNIPTLWIWGENDSVIDLDKLENNLQSLSNRIGVDQSPSYIFSRKPLTQQEFILPDSEYDLLIDLLNSENLIDQNSFLTFSNDVQGNNFTLINSKKTQIRNLLASTPILAPYSQYLEEQLLVFDGEHRFTQQFFPETIDFLMGDSE